MFFDATDTMDGRVVKAVEQLFSCCVPTDESHQKKKGSPAVGGVPLGRGHQLHRLRHVGEAKYTLFTAGGTPIRATCTVEPGGDRRRPGASRTRPPAALALTSVHTVVAGDSLASIAYRSTATRRCGARSPRSTASTTRCGCGSGSRCCCPPSTSSWPGVTWPQAQISNAFTVSSIEAPLPADLAPLLVSADVDDSLNLPDLVILRFRDADRTVLAKTNIKIGAKLGVAATSKGSTRRSR